MVQHHDLDELVIQMKNSKHQSEEKNYLIARDYHPGLVHKQCQKFEMTSRHNARKKNTKGKEVRSNL